MDPAELSRAFGIEAEHSFRAGDSRPRRSEIAPASVYTDSYWLGILPPQSPAINVSFPGDRRSQLAQERLTAETRTLSWAISLTATRFLRKHAELLRRIRSEGGEVSLLVAISAGAVSSFIVLPEASQAFGDWGVRIEFELSAGA
ncbi:MAG: hypothetical protein ACREUT_21875 [Steroidobacteraceae bacterium]